MKYRLWLLQALAFIFTGSFICFDCHAQTENNDFSDRVIYEQQTAYKDALMIKEKISQMEKEKQNGQQDDLIQEKVIPLISGDKADSGVGDEVNPQMLEMLKTLLKAMGIEDLPDADTEKKEKTEFERFQDASKFKKWEDRHKWKGIRTEDN